MKNTAIITGISGQDGALLAQLLLKKSYCVFGVIRSEKSSVLNLEKLGIQDKVMILHCDLQNYYDLEKIILKIDPSEVYNFAASTSVSNSIEFPFQTLKNNFDVALNLLEIIRSNKLNTKLLNAGSSEMFGYSKIKLTEDSQILPVNPYGSSKAITYFMTKNYRELYGLNTSTVILFNHESFLRDDKFFIKKLVDNALKIRDGKLSQLSFGNLNIIRDFGSAEEFVFGIWQIMNLAELDDYCICTGNETLLIDIVKYVFQKLNIDFDKFHIDNNLIRPNELDYIVGDNKRLAKSINWSPASSIFDVIDKMLKDEI